MKILLSSFIIVISTFIMLAFTPTKGDSYCASLLQNEDCAVINGKIETANRMPHATYYKYIAWDGLPAHCMTNRCETQTTFWNEP